MRQIALPDEAATVRLAEELAAMACPGDLILLTGDLGAGKSAFARAYIRAVNEDEAMEVPSPTFTLVQSYETARLPIAHVDLYRIGDESEVDELGIFETLAEGVVLVEWPERASARLAGDRLEVCLSLVPGLADARNAIIVGHGAWAERAARQSITREFVNRSGYGDFRRHHLQGDASTRRYERLTKDGRSAILMDAPKKPDPGVGAALPYSRIAHLAEDVIPFVADARTLRERGLSAPEIHAADLDAGLLILEDLGTQTVIDAAGRPIPERYAVAVDLLVHLHRLDLPDEAEAAPGLVHRLPRYDADAFEIEASLVLDWFAPHTLGRRLDEAAETEFRTIWRSLLAPLLADFHRSWVLRDFHSPNILWLDKRQGVARIGLLDFQDAVIGPSAYDAASLMMDARVDVPEELQENLFRRYIAGRSSDAGFEEEGFAREFAVMAAQRNSKILGIFARLARRDGKPRYLGHIPRISTYLERALGHPVLSPLKVWYDTHLPPDLRRGGGG